MTTIVTRAAKGSPLSYEEMDGNFTNLNGGSTTLLSFPARAWVNFNGTGTVAIRGSGNVSSITDIGVGTYNVNFATAMPDANYSVCVLGAGYTFAGSKLYPSGSDFYTTSSIEVYTAEYALGGTTFAGFDDSQMSVAVFR